MTVSLPPEIVEQRSDEREVFALINALRRQVASGTGGGGAPTDASYWVSTANATLTAEVNMGALASGILQHTVGAGVSGPGVVTIGVGLSYASPTLFLADTTVTPGSYTNSSITVDQQGRLTAASSGAAPAPSNATYITQTPDATLTNEQALSLLVSGVMQVTTATGVIDSFAVGTGLIPYGASSKLATTATFGFNAANGTLAVGVAPGAADASTAIHVSGASVSGILVKIQNTSAANSAYGSTFYVSDTGRGDVYFTSSTYATSDSLPNSLTFSTSPASGSIIFAPQLVRVLRLTNPDAFIENGSLRFNKAGVQLIEKQGSGDFYVGTLGAQLLGFYTNNITRMDISSGGNVAIANLTAGGVVYATNATGVLKIGTAAEVAAAITWPATSRVLYSTGTTTAPTGINGFEYDTGDNQLWLSNAHEQAWYNTGDGPSDTDYERVRAFWTGNVWNLKSEEAGTGVVRPMSIDADTSTMTLNGDAGLILSSATMTMLSETGGSGTGLTIDSTASDGNATVSGWLGIGLLTTAGNSNSSITMDWLGGVGMTLSSSPTVASGAAAVFDGITLNTSVSITGTTTIATATGFNAINIRQPTYAKGSGGVAVTVTNAATFYIENSPQQGAGVTLTNEWALWVDAGISRFDGNGANVFELPADATANATATQGRIPILVGGATKYLRYYND